MERRNFLGGLMAMIAGAAVPLKASEIGSQIPLETTPTIESQPPKKKKKKLKEPKVSDIVESPFDRHNRRSEIMMVDISSVTTNPAALRVTSNYVLKDLVESIRKVGMINPMIVRYIGNGQYAIIDGLARYLAAKEVGLTKVPIQVSRCPGWYDTVEPQSVWYKPVDARLLGIMKNSILSQGFVQPCLLVNHGTRDFPSYEIVDGSLRIEAARQLGMKIPAIIYDWCQEEIMEYKMLQGKQYSISERAQAESRMHRKGQARLVHPIQVIDGQMRYSEIKKQEAMHQARLNDLKVNITIDDHITDSLLKDMKKQLRKGILSA